MKVFYMTFLVEIDMSLHKNLKDKRQQIDYPIRQCTSMDELRDDIDRLDRRIVELLAVRQGYMEQAARIKEKRKLVRDERRIEDVVAKVLHHANKIGAHPVLAEKIYRDMIEWSINYELDVFDSSE